MKAKLSLQPSLARTSLGVTVVAALLSLSAASAAQAPAGEPVPKLNDRHPFLGPDARTSEYPVRIPMKPVAERSEEHTSELQSLMRISYAVFCLKKKNIHTTTTHTTNQQHIINN